MARVVALRTELRTDPLGLGERRPRLSWRMESSRPGEVQTAYQVRVGTSPGSSDLWDSGKVRGNRSVWVEYGGRPLRSRMRCFWTVRVWDADGRPTPFAETAAWEMGLLSPKDWKADWIGLPVAKARPEPGLAPEGARWIRGACLRKTFRAPAGAGRVLAYVAGGPQYSLQVNAREVAGGRREVEGQEAVWEDGAGASVVDVTDLLEPGENVLSANLAGEGAALLVRLQGVPVVSDTSWRASAENVKGWAWREAGFDDSAWGFAEVLSKQVPTKGLSPAPPRPAAYLRKTFALGKRVARARIHATALGVYELALNGKKVGDRHFAPEWTDYRKRLLYQTYDITALLRKGANVLDAVLADGWYSGPLGWSRKTNHFGPDPVRLRAQLELEFEDGSRQIVATDRTWKGSLGPIVSSGLLDGETVDARAGFRWGGVAVLGGPDRLEPQSSPPVRVTEILRPVAVSEPLKGVFVFDLGRNLTGWARIRAKGKRGTVVRLRFAEALKPDGTLYTANLRRARAADRFILKGRLVETFEPRFTFHGFRYVEVTGLPRRPGLEGVAANSDLPATGTFSCSSRQARLLQRNIVASQKGNFLSIPTDCPQRDERLGWTGDVQVFARTASFNMDTHAFLRKWLGDLRDAQGRGGAYPDVAPRIVLLEDGAPGWGNAGVIVPWVLYRAYGDRRILEENYGAMARWVAYVAKGNPDGLWRKRTAFQFGDWLSMGEETPNDLLATAFFAHDADRMSRIAKVLGRTRDAARYAALFGRIRRAFNRTFKLETQTACALACRFRLSPAGKRLAEAVRRRGGRLTTGFLGVSHLLPALTDAGEADLAYALFNRDDFPSWGYSIRHGATTIWERWDGWTEEKGFQDPGMNSFNHYAYGSVGEWMYETVGGIRPIEPGYRTFRVAPRPGGGLSWAKASYESLYGRIESAWRIRRGVLTLEVRVPPNTTAEVHVPWGAVVEAGSGRHRFRSSLPKSFDAGGPGR